MTEKKHQFSKLYSAGVSGVLDGVEASVDLDHATNEVSIDIDPDVVDFYAKVAFNFTPDGAGEFLRVIVKGDTSDLQCSARVGEQMLVTLELYGDSAGISMVAEAFTNGTTSSAKEFSRFRRITSAHSPGSPIACTLTETTTAPAVGINNVTPKIAYAVGG